MSGRSMAADMPVCMAFIRQLREAFGREVIDQQIKAGMAGDAFAFHASENGHEVGTPLPPADGISDIVVGRMFPPKDEDERGGKRGRF